MLSDDTVAGNLLPTSSLVAAEEARAPARTQRDGC
jgi:hypothetical protein